jgi:ABC-2 type transport system ATP-binding protein
VELKIRGLSKAYGSQVALQDVNLNLQPGTVVLLGPNGSGKTTLLRCLASLLKADHGRLWFGGLPHAQNLPWLRSQLGYLPQDLDLPPGVTPRRLLEYLGVLKHIPDENQVGELLSALGLEEIAAQPFLRLSAGQTRLAGIAQAFLGQPSLLLLDELTRGLDVEERERVLALARQPVPGRLILFSTHDPWDAGRLADHAIVLYQGLVIFAGKVGDLPQQAGGQIIPREG